MSKPAANTLHGMGFAVLATTCFAVMGGWLVFHHLPGQWTFVGIGMVALCSALGAWLTVRENRITIQPPES